MSLTKTGRLTHDVIACAKTVFARYGALREKDVYTEAMFTELSSCPYINGLERNPQLAVFYKGRKLAHTVTADFKIVNNGDTGLVYVVVLKQVSRVFQAELIKLLSATKCKAATILNFGKEAPDFCRVYVPNEKVAVQVKL
jgi:GxxExxY protein